MSDTPYAIVDGKPNQTASVPDQVELHVDEATAFNLRLQEFDKVIAEAESQVANLKAQKMSFIYTTNVNALLKRQQAPAS